MKTLNRLYFGCAALSAMFLLETFLPIQIL